MGDLKFFFDPISQPSRAVWIFLEANQIPYQSCVVDIAKGEHRTNEDFLKVSANKTVPAIDDNGFKLFESAAIMKYLAAKHNVPDHWYPKDIEKRAKIDEYLSWLLAIFEWELLDTCLERKYLAAKPMVPDHWYPKDIEKRANIDEYLSGILAIFEGSCWIHVRK
ncbi:glutathione S-transferase theta-1-like, partial [Gigantopelta aegis]|uniref:glutathione S-transferase theta-1-like n=1 Tax=Gigantopelta aegis TaxID=1735272 RepID=UPI001B88DD1E